MCTEPRRTLFAPKPAEKRRKPNAVRANKVRNLKQQKRTKIPTEKDSAFQLQEQQRYVRDQLSLFQLQVPFRIYVKHSDFQDLEPKMVKGDSSLSLPF